MKNSKYQADSGESNYFQPFDKMKLISAAELAKLNARTRKKHWGEPIQSNQIGMLFGPRGHGKTWVALGIAVSMSGVVAQMPVAAEVGSGDERDELGSG